MSGRPTKQIPRIIHQRPRIAKTGFQILMSTSQKPEVKMNEILNLNREFADLQILCFEVFFHLHFMSAEFEFLQGCFVCVFVFAHLFRRGHYHC